MTPIEQPKSSFAVQPQAALPMLSCRRYTPKTRRFRPRPMGGGTGPIPSGKGMPLPTERSIPFDQGVLPANQMVEPINQELLPANQRLGSPDQRVLRMNQAVLPPFQASVPAGARVGPAWLGLDQWINGLHRLAQGSDGQGTGRRPVNRQAEARSRRFVAPGSGQNPEYIAALKL